MTKQAQPFKRPRQGKLKITQDRVVAIIMRIIDSEGLEVAKEEFRHMNYWYSTERGWAETAEQVYAIFAEEQKRLNKEQRAARLEEQRAGAPSIIMVNQNEANGMKRQKFHSDQFTGIAESGVEIIHTKKTKK
jgi:hypothetical protein